MADSRVGKGRGGNESGAFIASERKKVVKG